MQEPKFRILWCHLQNPKILDKKHYFQNFDIIF